MPWLSLQDSGVYAVRGLTKPQPACVQLQRKGRENCVCAGEKMNKKIGISLTIRQSPRTLDVWT